MDITQKSDAAVQYMVEEIKKKLKMATGAAIKPTHFNEDHYEDIRDIYDMVHAKDSYSISEMEAIVNELGRLKRE
ncbi:DUF1128 domain-containing protein [Xylanibacillus composti]|uniref:UPF0435 protein n=1 Tax=Xylanibacillus composti TaxID=1572762 RepID=A0A8J4M4E0_9BACL|nr:DUF1128 domain-containing protein [Xylanibacillus composti]MDT9723691.1 DUF1128 domain-containing protein [Xylanibacillus composti]GIQ71030.1 UPF0435 protein [Xylanibacillus composti]